MNKRKYIILIGIVAIISLIVMKLNHPSYTDIKKLQPNMTVKQITHILGKPDDDIGSGTYCFIYNMKENKIAHLLFKGELLKAVYIENVDGSVEYIFNESTT